jgi:hypothetical protein
MAFRDYSNNDPFDSDDRRRYRDPRTFDDRSEYRDDRRSNQPRDADWRNDEWRGAQDGHDDMRRDMYRDDPRDQSASRYADTNWRNGPAPRNRYIPPLERHGGEDDRYMQSGSRRFDRGDDPYIRDQRRLQDRGEMQYGRDYGYADNHYYYDSRPQRDDDRHRSSNRQGRGSENVDAQQNYERDRPNFRGGGWDQGESMRSSHSMPGRQERDAYESDRGYERDTHDRSARQRGRYSSEPDAWSSMEHDWNGDHYYGGGQNRTGDYGSSGERYNWRDNFGRDRTSSRSGRGTTTGWTGGDRSLGSSDLGA